MIGHYNKNLYKLVRSFSADRSKAASLKHFFLFFFASVVSYVAFVLSSFVPHLWVPREGLTS